MEEDIKILKELRKELGLYANGEKIKQGQAIENKEVEDALYMLLHCSLKDKEYETQKWQFKTVYNYIEQLEKENENLVLNALNSKKYIDNECIPKSAIREKIKEIRKKAETSQSIELLIFDSKSDILEELLGEEN